MKLVIENVNGKKREIELSISNGIELSRLHTKIRSAGIVVDENETKLYIKNCYRVEIDKGNDYRDYYYDDLDVAKQRNKNEKYEIYDVCEQYAITETEIKDNQEIIFDVEMLVDLSISIDV